MRKMSTPLGHCVRFPIYSYNLSYRMGHKKRKSNLQKYSVWSLSKILNVRFGICVSPMIHCSVLNFYGSLTYTRNQFKVNKSSSIKSSHWILWEQTTMLSKSLHNQYDLQSLARTGIKSINVLCQWFLNFLLSEHTSTLTYLLQKLMNALWPPTTSSNHELWQREKVQLGW